MARQVNQALWDQWRQRLKRQRESGLSIADFCRKENVSPHGFHAWRRKLGQATSRRQSRSRRQVSHNAVAARHSMRRRRVFPPRGSRGPGSSAAPPQPTSFLQLPVTAVRPSPWIELTLADGTVLRLPQQNLAALIAVLRVLRGERLELPEGEGGHA
jgi:hypothetical protein